MAIYKDTMLVFKDYKEVFMFGENQNVRFVRSIGAMRSFLHLRESGHVNPTLKTCNYKLISVKCVISNSLIY